MRWESPRKTQPDEWRDIKRFAWVPHRIDDTTVWLERYGVRQQFMDARDNGYWADRTEYTLDYI